MEPEPEPQTLAAPAPAPEAGSNEAEAGSLQAAEARKAQGTVLFRAGDYAAAAAEYEAALSLVVVHPDGDAEASEQLLLSLRLNGAAACLKTDTPTEALAHCEAALALDASSSKALYRKGQALLALGQPAPARAALKEAYKLVPKDKQVIALLRSADTAAKRAKEEQRNRMSRALGGLSDSTTTATDAGAAAVGKQPEPEMSAALADEDAARPNLAFYCNRREISSSYPWEPGVKPPPLPCFSVISQQTQFGTTRLLTFRGTIDELLEAFGGRDEFAYAQLEGRHDYIQWLFPSPERSRFNMQSTPLSPAEAAAICADSEAKIRVRRAYELILDFYGFELADLESGALRCSTSRSCEARFANLNTAFNHNFMRISRVLNCLNATGWQHYVLPMLSAFYTETFETGRLGCCAQSFASHWVQLLGEGWDATARLHFPKLYRQAEG